MGLQKGKSQNVFCKGHVKLSYQKMGNYKPRPRQLWERRKKDTRRHTSEPEKIKSASLSTPKRATKEGSVA